MRPYDGTLGEYGGQPEAVRWFDQDGPALLPYATLMHARRGGVAGGDPDLAALLGVYEWQNAPLLFLVDGDKLTDKDHFLRLRRKLALRGDAPYLGLMTPGRLTVHGISLDAAGQQSSRIPEEDLGSLRRATLARLASTRPRTSGGRGKWISNIVLALLGDAIDALVRSHIEGAPDVSKEDAVSIAGRALFIRFLGDRNLLPPALVRRDSADLFKSRKAAEATSRWLDATFNGDILPVAEGVFASLDAGAFGALADIMRKASQGQLYLGWQAKWDYLDFAHIPVGVLSQAYEEFMREHRPEKQHKEGGFYTPRAIADLVVSVAFQGLRHLEKPGEPFRPRVLDPASGAGVFLLSAFRFLVAKRWEDDKVRPDTKVLREILYDQISGFDINEEALRFAALGLYLMSIELDPDPAPVTKLIFSRPLRGKVLFKRDDAHGLGSLGKVSDVHAGRYHLVVGNPPWTTGTRLPWKEVQADLRDFAKIRLQGENVPESLTPNECLDLPFVWRAMQWGVPEGQIAFALHARLLFQQGDGMPEARLALFRALDVTGIINGAEVRKTAVWPNITAPFCLMWARNRTPMPTSAFRYVSPRLETDLNRAGMLRLDPGSAELVTTREIGARPELFKALFRGTRLDVEILERMTTANAKPLDTYWGDFFGRTGRKLHQSGNGYQKLRDSSKVRLKKGDGLPGVSAQYLHDTGWKELTPSAMSRISIVRARLRNFAQARIHDPRDIRIFEGPLLIVAKAPPAGSKRMRTGVSNSSVIYNESYYGYSAKGRPEGATLVKYLALVLGSRFALWSCLMTSGEFGVEREVIEKSTLEKTFVIPLERLTSAARERIHELFDLLSKDDCEENWTKVDAWVASLYGLSEEDVEVMNDTLSYDLPFGECVTAAQQRPDDLGRFKSTLASELRIWAEEEYDDVVVEEVRLPGETPWIVMRVYGTGPTRRRPTDTLAPDAYPAILQLANLLGAAELVSPEEPGRGLGVARLAQARYWTASQARLLARHIIGSHLDALFGSSE